MCHVYFRAMRTSRRSRKGPSEGPLDPPRSSAFGRSPTALTRLTLFLSLTALVGLMLGTAWRADAKRAGGKAPAGSAPDCKKDDDCVLVSDDCCSCNQGGKARAIPKKQKDAYEKDRKKRC